MNPPLLLEPLEGPAVPCTGSPINTGPPRLELDVVLACKVSIEESDAIPSDERCMADNLSSGGRKGPKGAQRGNTPRHVYPNGGLTAQLVVAQIGPGEGMGLAGAEAPP